MRPWPYPALIVLAFATSRWIVFALGIRSSDELTQMQMVDGDLLAGDLSRSTFFLHSQPPLFNALIGGLLKISGSHFPIAVSLVYWMAGLVIAILMYRFIVDLSVQPGLACAATLAFVLAPACLLYETYNLYTYLVAALLIGATHAVYKYCATGRTIHAAVIALLLSVIGLTRSLFHLIWAVAAIALIIWLRRPTSKNLLILVSPAVILSAWYFKNLVLFGFFGASSLMGLNLFRITTELQPPDTRLKLAESGVLSPYALYPVNHPIDHYPVFSGPLHDVDIAFRGPRALLPRGWSDQVESGPTGSFVWSEGPWSVLVLPQAPPGPVTLTLRCAPFLFPGAPQQIVEIRINSSRLASLVLADELADYPVVVPAGTLNRSLNLVVFRYAYALAPKAQGLSNDPRELAVRWESIRVDPPPSSATAAGFGSDALPPNVPVLDRILQERGGQRGGQRGGPNLNHRLYPAVMREYERDAMTVLRLFPLSYARAVARAGLIFLAPPHEIPAFRVKRARIARWDRFYSRWVYGASDAHWPAQHSHRSRWQPTRALLGRVGWASVALALLVAVAAVQSLRDPRRCDHAATIFAIFNIAFVAFFGSLLEYGENNRFRMEVEPLFWAVGMVAAIDLARRRGRVHGTFGRGAPSN